MKTILLVGRSGNGKSSIGNSILGQNVFKTSQSLQKKFDLKKGENEEITVIDCSVIGDTRKDMCVPESEILKQAKDIKTHEVDAIMFVMKYGVRFTYQEKQAVHQVKNIFGEDVFRKKVILAFSYGDTFVSECESAHQGFNDWCSHQSGDIQEIFQEVDYRCLLFNNKASNEKYSKQKLVSFMNIIQVKNSEDTKDPKRSFCIIYCVMCCCKRNEVSPEEKSEICSGGQRYQTLS